MTERMTPAEAKDALCSTLEVLLELASQVHTGELKLIRPEYSLLDSFLSDNDRQGELLEFLRLGFSQCVKVYRALGGPDCSSDDFRALAQLVSVEVPAHNGSYATH